MLVFALSSCGADAYMKKGDQHFAIGEYFDAAEQYKKAYSNTPAKERATRGKRAAKLAECYRRINFTQKAIAAYNNVIRYNQADSLTHLRLAQQLMKTANYRQAQKAFATAVDSMPHSLLAKNGLTAAQKAPEWKKQGSAYTVKRENMFNSRRADFSPMIAGEDNDRLYFSSTRPSTKGDELSGITGTKTADIFFSQKDERGKWTKPQTIDTELNSDYDEGACSFSPDGRTMFLTQCKIDPAYPRYATIVTSQRSDAEWGKPQLLDISKDSLSSFAHPAVSPDGQWLYFTSDMPGGEGGLDIWRIRLGRDGIVGGVENLGKPINTEGDEMFPTFRPNGDLYFSSNGHPGMGGLDIFMAKLDSTRKGWLIEHPGFPLNSEGDDFGMTFEGLKNQGFFSSNRGDARGYDHIFSFYNPEIMQTVIGWVYEKDGYELPAAIVYMVGNDGTNLKLNVKGDGSFTQQLKPNVDYVFLGTCKGYLNHQQQENNTLDRF